MQQNQTTWWQNVKYRFFDDKSISSRRKFYNTIWAVVFGFIVSGIIISCTGNNPFGVFASIFEQGLTTFGNKLISIFIAYLFAALGVSICFKAGLFNMGISGQMMSAGFTTLLIFRSDLLHNIEIGTSSIVLAFFISMLMGAFVGMLAGILKAYFKINEVVSTIMLNWVIFFIIKFLIFDYATYDGQDFLATSDSLSSNLSNGYILPNFFYPTNLNSSWYSNSWNWIIIVLGIIMVLVIWFTLAKTSFGYKIKMIGLNKDASEYSGTNQKFLILSIMSISGALSGIAGFIWYIGQGGQIDIAEQPLLAGFDAVAISLLVFNNPISIVISSFLYGIFSVGSSGISSEFAGMQKELNQIIIGVFIYCAAITVVFNKFKLYTWMKKHWILMRYNRVGKSFALLKNNSFFKRSSKLHKFNSNKIKMISYWRATFKYWFSFISVNKQISKIKKENKSAWKQINNKAAKEVSNIESIYNSKYKLKSFDIKVLSNEDRELYFEQLVSIKREKDILLAEHKYFEKNEIKSKPIIEYNNYKKVHKEYQESLIKHYYENKKIRKAGR